MAYTAQGPIRPDSDVLRARIPGWGVDLPAQPPSDQKVAEPIAEAHWEFPDLQPENRPRERSIEHKMLTPVFGTTAPLKGLSGAIRRHAYAKYSETRAAHWLLLLGADRVDAVEAHIASLFTLRPDNPITETGIKSEFTHHGFSSRVGRKRADRSHTWIDPILVAGPWVLFGIAVVRGAGRLAALTRRRG
ncbi:hypothetical protein [Mycolicibacterium goodii]|uniref:Uncharacterized protein n=1 Tax=Mycolicibacterium goodii TaxID=134601 RepID=A0A0K0X0Q7_MYCGD|nr:hypothetical protein AFA91_02240 [Mycolicibacterium goodii]